METNNLTPWIYEEDLIYEFGYRKRVFTTLQDFGIKRAVFFVNPVHWLHHRKHSSATYIKEVISACSRYNIEPIIAFLFPWGHSNNHSITDNIFVIPKTATAVCEYLKMYYRVCANNLENSVMQNYLSSNRMNYLVGIRVEPYNGIYNFLPITNTHVYTQELSDDEYSIFTKKLTYQYYDMLVLDDRYCGYSWRDEIRKLCMEAQKIKLCFPK